MSHQGSVVEVVAVNNLAIVKEQGYLAYGGIDAKRVPGTEQVPRQAYTGKQYEEALRLYYFGARDFDPELGIWLVPDAAGQFVNPYSYGNGSPVMGVDADGNVFWITAAIGAAVGAVVGGTGSCMNDHCFDQTFWENTGKGAAVGLIVGASMGLATTAVAGVAASTQGAVALGTTSGLAGTMAGGAVTGLASGAAGAFAGYTAGTWASNDFNDFDGWNVGDAAKATLIGAGTGAVMGAGMNGIQYGLSNNFRNVNHQQNAEYGWKHGRQQASLDYTKKMYNLKGTYTYAGEAPTETPQLRGRVLGDGSDDILIFDNAFKEPGKAIGGKIDGSSLIATMDHEEYHLLHNPLSIEEANGYGLSFNGTPSPGGAYLESQAYNYGTSVATSHGYSQENLYYSQSMWRANAKASGVLPWNINY